jgi:hypothetical protein
MGKNNSKSKNNGKNNNKSRHKDNNTTRIQNKWTGYYLEDCDCAVCPNQIERKGKKRGCKYDKCCFEDEKQDAIANGRIKRKRGSMTWDG